jgi:HAD superfamily hydrolase (TIGR01509 family)
MIKGAVFDVDGTILDSMPIWYNVGNIYLDSLGIAAEQGLSDKLFSLALNDGADYLNERYGLHKTRQLIIKEIGDIVSEFYRNSVPLKKGAGDFLEKLNSAGIRVNIATAGDLRYMKAAFDRLGVSGYFNKFFTCPELNTSKNEPYIYLKASEDFECSASDVYVFEDADSAAKTAKDAGFKVAGVYDEAFEDFQDELKRISDIYITDYNDLDLNMFT